MLYGKKKEGEKKRVHLWLREGTREPNGGGGEGREQPGDPLGDAADGGEARSLAARGDTPAFAPDLQL